jgi:hypothetical protein
MSVLSLMNHRVTIQRSAQSPSRGVQKKTWSDLATDVRCRIHEKRGSINTGQAGQSVEYDAWMFVPASTDIRPKNATDEPDRVVVTSHPAYTGTTFGVVWAGDRSGKASHLTVYLRRRPAGD